MSIGNKQKSKCKRKCLKKLIRAPVKLLRYAVALSLLAFFLNLDQNVQKLNDADDFLDSVMNGRSLGMSKLFFKFCKKEMINYFYEARQYRRAHLNSLKSYTESVIESLMNKDYEIKICFEKIYSLTSLTHESTFENLYYDFKKLSGDSDFFDKQFEKMYEERATRENLPEEQIKEVMYYILDVLKQTNWKEAEFRGDNLTPKALELVKKLYVTDKAYNRFDIEDEDIMKAKALQTSDDLQRMFRDIVKLIKKKD